MTSPHIVGLLLVACITAVDNVANITIGFNCQQPETDSALQAASSNVAMWRFSGQLANYNEKLHEEWSRVNFERVQI